MQVERTLILTKSGARLSSEAPLVFGRDDTVVFNVDTFYNLSESTITLRNGSQTYTARFTAPFVVPAKVLFSGWLSISVAMFLSGEKVKSWQLLPFKLVESDGTVCPVEPLKSFDERLHAIEENKANSADFAALKAQVIELTEKHNKLTEIVSLLKEY